MENNNAEKAINDIKNFEKALEEASNNEDAQNDPNAQAALLMYQSISETCIETLQMDLVVDVMNKIADKVGNELATDICSMMALIMTNSAYNAIMFYDQILNNNLIPKFEEYDEVINNLAGTTQGINSAMEVFKKRLNELQEKVNKNVS